MKSEQATNDSNTNETQDETKQEAKANRITLKSIQKLIQERLIAPIVNLFYSYDFESRMYFCLFLLLVSLRFIYNAFKRKKALKQKINPKKATKNAKQN